MEGWGWTDVHNPAACPADLAAEARVVRPGLPVLFTIGYARDATVHHGRLDTGLELPTMPFTYADLESRVRDVIDGH